MGARNLLADPDMNEDSEASSQICSICNIKSPPTDTNYTLISSRHGWRLALETLPDGTRSPIWRCPPCWQEYRKKQAANAAVGARSTGRSLAPRRAVKT
jgi:hypothetical protein